MAINPATGLEYEPIPQPPEGLLASAVGTPTAPLPPLDPNAYENDDIVAEMNKITSQDSDYMKLANTAGLQTANKRGLLNSSMAAGAAQAEAIRAAAPLAAQNSQNAAARNLARVQGFFERERQQAQFGHETQMQARQLTAAEEAQLRDITNKLQMQGIDINNQQQMQNAQLTAAEQAQLRDIQNKLAMQQTDIAAQYELQGRQLTAQQEAQLREIAAQYEMQGRQLTSAEMQQMREIAARMEMQGIDIESQQFMQQQALTNSRDLAQMQIEAESERLGRQLTAAEEQQLRDLASRQTLLEMELLSREELTQGDWQQQMERLILSEAGATDRANLDAATRTQLMELENLSQEQIASLNFYLNSNEIYARSLDQLYNNQDMPAPARDAAIQNMLALRNSSINLPATLFGTNLSWPTSPTSTTNPATALPAPAPSTTYPSTTTPSTSPTINSGLGPVPSTGFLGGLLGWANNTALQ